MSSTNRTHILRRTTLGVLVVVVVALGLYLVSCSIPPRTWEANHSIIIVNASQDALSGLKLVDPQAGTKIWIDGPIRPGGSMWPSTLPFSPGPLVLEDRYGRQYDLGLLPEYRKQQGVLVVLRSADEHGLVGSVEYYDFRSEPTPIVPRVAP